MLSNLFRQAGLTNVETTYLDTPTIFKDFKDYWTPFLGGQGPASTYLTSLSNHLQSDIKNILQKKLPIESDGSIRLLARAIAVRGENKK